MTCVRRRLASALPVLLVLVPLGVTTPVGSADTARAAAAAPTCAGEPATLVGRPRQYEPTRGTSHRDVIVTNGASVEALGGDDLICITGGDSYVDAGRGDDEVHNLVVDDSPTTDLGPGFDHYHGSAGPESVYAGDEPGDVDEPDVVELGAGDDVFSGGSESGTPMADDVDLGDGDDHADVLPTGLTAGARLVGGQGIDSLSFGDDPDPTRARWVVHNSPTTGTASADGDVRAEWDGFETFYLDRLPGPLTFTGGDGVDRVSSSRLVAADLGGGDDEVSFWDTPGRSSLEGGDGVDLVSLWCDGSFDVDLGAGTSTCVDRRSGPRDAVRSLSGFEAAELSGYDLDVRGSARADDIQVLGCHGVVRGLGGRDRIRAVFEFGRSAICFSPYRPLLLLGGPGDDVVQGSPRADNVRGGPGDDVLRGGLGRDLTVGGPGDDRCTTELARACEVVRLTSPVDG
jgi:Ca2+-binding RTX toxin-like protein